MNVVLKDKLGYFDNDAKEYVIENAYPKRPLKNYLWSEDVVLDCDQFGFGGSMAAINGFRRKIDVNERLLFIKDKRTGEVYSPNRNYHKLPFDEHVCHVGIGYQKIISAYRGVRASFTLTVPTKGYVIAYDVELENAATEDKELAVTFVTSPFTQITGHDAYGIADKDERGGLYFSHIAYKSPTEYGCAYLSADKPFDSYAVDLEGLAGGYGSIVDPKNLYEDALPSKGNCFLSSYLGSLSYNVTLAAGEKKRFTFALAIGKNVDEAATLSKQYANAERFDETVAEQKSLSESAFGRYQARLPQDDYVQTLVNIWLKRQVSLGKTWGRLYGKGFRDRMQDVTAFTAFDPATARTIILDTLSHQRENGNPIRQFEPDVPEVYNDGAVWIPEAIGAYIKESGDYTILDEIVPYLEGSSGTVFDHMLQGLRYLLSDVGERGLVLFREGDWNDSTNDAGHLGKGESVWTSLATVRALKQFAELCEKIGKKDLAAEMLEESEKLAGKVLEHGLIDGRLIHGYDDWGNQVGGGDEKTKEGSFCINMQTWAVLAGVGDRAFQEGLLDQVEAKVKCSFGYKLANRAYTKPVKGVGRTSYFAPGVYENAAVYVHSNMFKAVADCLLDRGDTAYETVCNTLYRHNPDSGVEPYAVTNMFLGTDNPFRVGDAPLAWITGSAGWMYRVLTEFILGVRAGYEGLEVAPILPSAWKNYAVEREYRGGMYELNFVRTGKFGIFADGKKIEGNVLPLLEKGERKAFTVEF